MAFINILFPVYNEKLRLENGIRKTINYLDVNFPNDYVLTIVDNASTDETQEIANKLCSEFSQVHYIRIQEKGVGVAVRKGVSENTSEVVGYMDVDLSTDINHLAEVSQQFKTNNSIDMVNGSRWNKKSDTQGRKWYRKITSMGLVILLKTVLKMKSSDAVCGFTFTRKETAEKLVKECGPEKGWFYTIEFLLRAERAGMKIYDMPVEWTEDYNTTVKIWKTIKNYLVNINRLHKTFKQEDKLNVKKN